MVHKKRGREDWLIILSIKLALLCIKHMIINSIKVNTGNIIVYTYLTEIECKGEKEELTFFSFSLFFPSKRINSFDP